MSVVAGVLYSVFDEQWQNRGASGQRQGTGMKERETTSVKQKQFLMTCTVDTTNQRRLHEGTVLRMQNT